MNCDRCSLNYGPYCTDLRSNYDSGYMGDDCPSRTFVRTEVGNFYACPKNMHQFGSGTAYGIIGWYPGRGY